MNQITLPQVWVVDDDADIRELLSTYLSQNGFQVSVADGGAALRQMLSQASPDVLVLDLMMPGEDGLSLTRFIKSHWDIPILMLSARGEEMDRIIGLEVGADDYLPKPFGPRELLARLRALLRRHPPAPHATERPSAGPSITPVTQPALDILTFGPFRLNTAARTLKRDEQDIELTTAEFELLEALVRRPLRVLSRDMLISLLKGYERDAFDRSIDNRVTRLRRKIESGPASPHYIRTVRGEGYLECWTNGRWYEPPVDPSGLAKTFRASTHHASALYFKRNLLASRFVPHRWLNRETFSAWALDYLVFGNAYLERPRNLLGGAMQLRHALAKYVRRGGDALERYWFVQSTQEHEFTPGSLHHLREHDINQEVYGLPEYLAALQSAWLNESATLFRRRYYNNGSHAGFILYISDAQQQQADVDNIREALKNSKGPGNFRNLFLYSPGGKKDGVQVIPVSEVAARDEFIGIKNVSRDDVLAAHRIPPQLMGIVPQNSGGFGSITEAAKIFHASEIEPLQQRLAMINDWLGEEVVTFLPYVTEAPAAGA